MSLKLHKFARKPFYVDAVRVSESNFEDVAKWCEGTIDEGEDGKFISVEVYRPATPRQTQAFVGDWVLFSSGGFKVYTAKAFDKAFEKVKTLTKDQADAAGIRPPIENPDKPAPKKGAGKAMGKMAKAPRRNGPAPTTNVGEAIKQAEAKQGQPAEHPVKEEKPAAKPVDVKRYMPSEPPRSPEEAEADALVESFLKQTNQL